MRVVEGVAEIDDVEDFVARLGEIGDEHGVAVQAFDARYVVDRAHLERAVALANRAVDRGEAIADDPAVEILCYAAGRRQINRALEMGVSTGECPVVVVVDDGGRDRGDGSEAGEDSDTGEGNTASTGNGGSDASNASVDSDEAEAGAAVEDLLEPAATLGAADENLVRSFFDVGETELAATDGTLADLVRERVALLVVER
jgi:KEOPS complex subunit Cgi121